MKLSATRIDPVKLEQGDWVDMIPELDGLRLKTRGLGNRDHRKLQAKLLDAIPRGRKVGGRLLPEDQDRVTARLLLETCLLDWDGLEDESGAALPYSKEQAEFYLNAPEHVKFRDGCLWAASVVAEIADAGIEADAKN